MLKEKIQNNLKKALKEKKELEVSVLRLLSAAIFNKEKEKRYKLTRLSFPSENLSGQSKGKLEIDKEKLEKESQLTDEEVIEVVSSEIKKRKEAFEFYKKGNRLELAEKEKKEIKVLESFLPKQLSEQEIKKLAKEIIKKIGVSEPKDMGKVMAELMPKVKGKIEGSLVSKIVKELLIF